MAKTLNAAQVKALKYAGKGKSTAYGIDSSCSLYLVCFDNGSKFYKFRDKKLITIANFADITLAEARQRAMELKKGKTCAVSAKKMRLADAFNEWLDIKIPDDGSEAAYQKRRKLKNRTNKWILEPLGDKFLAELNKAAVIKATKKAHLTSAKKALPILRDVLKYARSQNAVSDIAFIYEILEDMDEIYVKLPVSRRKAVTDKARLSEIIKTVKSAYINETIKNLFFFNLITAQRPHQIRELTWDRVDLDEGFVYFGESDNKTKINARLPLPDAAIGILEKQAATSGRDGIVFKSNVCSARGGWKISENTLLKTLKNLGIDDLHAHGFRSMLATFAIRAVEKTDGVERGKFEKRIIDEVLLHTRGSEVDKAYFRDFNSREHKRLLEWWSDFLKELGA
jgi:30S ribosomal protein S15